MSARDLPCALGLTSATLSDWQAHMLPATEATAIGQHIPGCRSCQHVLGQYNQIAQALRRQNLPLTGAPLWRATQTTISQRKQRHMNQNQKFIVAGGLGALAVLVLTFAIVLATALPDHATSTTAPTAISHPTGTATHSKPTPGAASPTPPSQPLQVSPAQGWVTSGLTYGKALTFAPSAPLTGYACGNSVPAAGQKPLLLGITHDGGRTWSAPTTVPALGATCTIAINPANPQDLVFIGWSCWEMCGDGYPSPYRSLDGGATWTALSMGNGNSALPLYNPIWVGDTLFMQPFEPSNVAVPQRPPHMLAVSHNNGAFIWVNDVSIVQQFPSTDAYIAGAFGADNSFTVLYGTQCPKACGFFHTSDGTTWQRYTPTGTLPYLMPFLQAQNGILIATGPNASIPIVRSTDGGQSWNPIPTTTLGALSGTFIYGNFAVSRDGTLYLMVGSAPQRRLLALPANSQTWQAIVTIPTASNQSPFYSFATISFKDNGQLNAIWGSEVLIVNHNLQPGIVYHAPGQ